MNVAIRAFLPGKPTFSIRRPKDCAMGTTPLSVPRNSPLGKGWRRKLVAMLEEHGLVDVLDTVSAFAELAVRREPDTAEDPLDGRSVPLHELLPGWFHGCKGYRSRISLAEHHRGLFAAVSPRRVADPAIRRIETVAIPPGPGRPRLEE
jgi:hypothetical protein